VRFGAYCFGSSVGLMLVLVAVDVMSIPLMLAIAGVVLAQKLLPPSPALDVPLALAIVALGVAIPAT
jgi:predicted metal-binding membrane protein